MASVIGGSRRLQVLVDFVDNGRRLVFLLAGGGERRLVSAGGGGLDQRHAEVLDYVGGREL